MRISCHVGMGCLLAAAVIVCGVGLTAEANIFVEGVDVGTTYTHTSGTLEGSPAIEMTAAGDVLSLEGGLVRVDGGTGTGVLIRNGMATVSGGVYRAGTDTGNALLLEGGSIEVFDGEFYAGGEPGETIGTGTGLEMRNATGTIHGGSFAAGRSTGWAVEIGEGASLEILGGSFRAGGDPGGTSGTGVGVLNDGGVLSIGGGSFEAGASTGTGVSQGAGEMTIEAGTFRAGGSTGTAVAVSGGTATIAGGDFNVTTGNALSVSRDAEVTIDGGSFSSLSDAITVGFGTGGDLTIHDITLVNTQLNSRGLMLWGGKTVIHGGTFHNLTSGGTMIDTIGDPVLAIHGGDFQNTNGVLLDLTFSDGYSITGGSFIAGGPAVKVGLNGTVRVSGGQFESLAGEEFEVRSDALLQVVGQSFWVDGSPIDLGDDLSYFVPELTGELTVLYNDGTLASFGFRRVFDSSRVQLIPEPAGVLMLGAMGMLVVRRRRRCG